MSTQSIRFNRNGREFYADLRKEVDAYFTDNGISTYGNTQMYIKTATLFLVYFGSYALIMSQLFSPWGMLGLAVLMGFGKAGIGFSIAHDAIHGAYSTKKWVNKLLGYSMNMIGGSSYVWSITHNKLHHTYTNIAHVDEDLDVTAMMRLSPNDKFRPIHRYQHLYFPIIYSLATFFWVFVKDYKKLSQKQIGPYKADHPRKEVLTTIALKLVYYSYTIVLPLLILNITWWQFIIGFLTMHFVAGLTLGIVFQLAHVVEETGFPAPDEEGRMEDNWAILQMKTTANFAPNNKFVNWYVGGLNFQVEHHLFPNICSIHYLALSPIVKRVAEQHDVPYYMHPTFFDAVHSHINTLKRYGKYWPRESDFSKVVEV